MNTRQTIGAGWFLQGLEWTPWRTSDYEKGVCALQGLRFGVETSRRFWKIQKECRTEPALPVVVPPIPHALVFFPDLLQLDLIVREWPRGKQKPKPLFCVGCVN